MRRVDIGRSPCVESSMTSMPWCKLTWLLASRQSISASGTKPVQQSVESIKGWRLLFVALYLSCFGRTHGARRSNHKVNVVIIRAFGRIYALFRLLIEQ